MSAVSTVTIHQIVMSSSLSDSFYITLPSNVKNERLSNKIGNYVTDLPSKLNLSKDWKVGLVEIQYTNSWFNLKTDERVRIVTRVNKTPISDWITLKAGRYIDIYAIINEISHLNFSVRLTGEKERIPELRANILAYKLMMREGIQNEKALVFEFSKGLAEIFGVTKGFDCCQFENEGSYYIAKGTYDLSAGIDGLFVYSDVVDYSIVGNTRAQLLRVVKVGKEDFGDKIDITYDKPFYLPLASTEISTIEIDIKDGAGEPIDFKFGRVEIVLHFMRNG